METVEVVIKLKKERYDELQKNKHLPNRLDIEKAITDGTVLPKGHGDLKDYDAIKSDYIHKMSVFMSEEERMDLLCTIVDEAPAIIDADRGDNNG